MLQMPLCIDNLTFKPIRKETQQVIFICRFGIKPLFLRPNSNITQTNTIYGNNS
jgi:hypothetical protein